MPIFQTKKRYRKTLLYFCGNSEEWDNLIVKNSRYNKEVYVCEPSLAVKYPSGIKVIRSLNTARRFVLGLSPESNAIVFVNATKDPRLTDENTDPFLVRVKYLVRRLNIDRIAELLKSGFIDIGCRRNIGNLKVYK